MVALETERRALVDVNVHGLMNGTIAALEPCARRTSGHVINIVSLAGLAAPPGETVYAATKHAALAFTIGTLYDLRQQGLRGVRVSAVARTASGRRCCTTRWTTRGRAVMVGRDASAGGGGDAAVELLDKPRPVVSMPRWRGGVARAFAISPRLGASGGAGDDGGRPPQAEALGAQACWRRAPDRLASSTA